MKEKQYGQELFEAYIAACDAVGFDEDFKEICFCVLCDETTRAKYGDPWRALIEFIELVKQSTIDDEQHLLDTVLEMSGIKFTCPYPTNFD